MTEDDIIAIGMLTQRDIDRLGPTFARLYPVDDTPCFEELLRAIDEKVAVGPGVRDCAGEAIHLDSTGT